MIRSIGTPGGIFTSLVKFSLRKMPANLNPQVAALSTGALPAAVDSRPAPRSQCSNALTLLGSSLGNGRLHHVPGALDSLEPRPQLQVLAFQIRHAASRHHQVLGQPSQCDSDPRLSITHGALIITHGAPRFARGGRAVQGGPHAPPGGGAHHYYLLSRSNLDGSVQSGARLSRGRILPTLSTATQQPWLLALAAADQGLHEST